MTNPTKATVLGSLAIRADASSQIGTGHVMRCLALAQAWQRAQGQVVFAQAESTGTLGQRLRNEGIEVVRLNLAPGSAEDAAATIAQAHACGALCIVADGYHFGTEWQKQVKDGGFQLLLVDDYGHAKHYYADYVLNQNVSATSSLYNHREHYTKLLLGTRYVLLRQEFLKWREWKREMAAPARKILVTLGGSDPDNLTAKVIQALSHFDNLETVIVAGGSNPNLSSLQAAICNLQSEIRLVVNATNMPHLMAWADVAIAAGGITSWELAFMGLPSLLVIQANNQCATVERLSGLGVARNLGRPGSVSSYNIARELENLLAAVERRTEMARRGRGLVDGNGATRVLMHLSAHRLQIRKAREDDGKQLWEWANDPDVRAVSFSSEPISWEQHIEWFRSKLNNPACVLHIGTHGGEIPVGQIRYDSDGDQAIVSVSLDRRFRGKGYGSRLIWLSSQEVFDTTAINTLHAYVKEANETSVRAFEKAGYQNLGTTIVDGHEALNLVLSRSAKDAS